MKFIFKVLLFTCLLQSISMASQDPCLNEEDKISCITNLIEQETLSINSLLETLNAPGEKGEQGLQGAKGQNGEKGDEGEDGVTEFHDYIYQRDEELRARRIQVTEFNRENIVPHFYINLRSQDDLMGKLQFARSHISSYNRNPHIIGGVFQTVNSDIERYFDTLAFPQVDNDNSSIVDVFSPYMEEQANTGLGNYRYLSQEDYCIYNVTTPVVGNDVRITKDLCPGDAGYDIDEYATRNLCETFPKIGLCRVVSSLEQEKLEQLFDGATDSIVSTELDLSVDISDIDFEDVEFETNPPIIVSGASDFANFKLGMDYNDPLYQLVLEKTLDFIERHELEIFSIIDEADEEIVQELEEAIAVLESINFPIDQLNILKAQASGITTGLNNAKTQLTLLAENNEYSKSVLSLSGGRDDLMRYLLVVHLVDIYVDQRSGDLIFTQAQLDAGILNSISKIEIHISEFAKARKKRVRQLVNEERLAFLELHPGIALDILLGQPSTPDFIEAAETRLVNTALISQPAAITDFYLALDQASQDGEVQLLELLPLASAAIAASTGVDPEQVAKDLGHNLIMKIVDKAVKKISIQGAKIAMKALGYAGRIGSTGPAKIIALAFEIGITEGIEVFEQADKDERYRLFMAQDFEALISTDEMDDVEVSSLLHDWIFLELGENVLLGNEVYVLAP